MADERDYDVMKAKVPRTDLEGNDVTQHDLGGLAAGGGQMEPSQRLRTTSNQSTTMRTIGATTTATMAMRMTNCFA